MMFMQLKNTAPFALCAVFGKYFLAFLMA